MIIDAKNRQPWYFIVVMDKSKQECMQILN